MLLFSRWEHGNKPVEIDQLSRKFSVDGKVFPSWKDTSEYLYGYSNSMSFNGYFRRSSKYRDFLYFRESFSKTLQDQITQEVQTLTDFLTKSFGIDLSLKSSEIKKLVYSGFNKKVSKYYDPEDVLQEVFKGILIRNKGKCPFDQEKSSLGNYVHMVSSCVISNYHNKQSRYINLVDKNTTTEASVVVQEAEGNTLIETSLQNWIMLHMKREPDLSKQILSMVLEGFRISEISRNLEVPLGKVSKKVKKIRELTALWAENQHLGYMVPKKFQKEN